MGKLVPHIVTITVLVVILEFVLMGCVTWDQAKLAETPATTVTDHSLEPKEDLKLPELVEEDGRIWLETDPIQGWNNPWREWMWEEWIGRHYEAWMQTYQDYWIGEHDFPDCPNHCEQNGNNLPDRACVIECLVKYYYLTEEITIYNVKTSTYQEKFGQEIAICEAEDCPAGYTLYIQVAETDVDTMRELGYRNIITSCETIPPNVYVYGCNQ
jgi:hypothetical protein